MASVVSLVMSAGPRSSSVLPLARVSRAAKSDIGKGVRGQGTGVSRSFRAPSRQSREAICTVADHGHVVWNRLRPHPKFGDNAGFIAQGIAPAIELNDSCTHNALTEIFVRCTNEHLIDTLFLGCFVGGRSERIIRLKVDHWPHHHSHCLQRLLKDGELRQQLGSYSFAGLVSGIQIVPKRLHNVIRCHANVSCASFDHGQNGRQDAADCADFPAVHIFCGRHGEKVPEQFICPVNQVHIHAAPISFLQAILYGPARRLPS